MSGADDNFLARWSRRKQAVERAEQSEPPEQPEPTRELAPAPPAAEEEPAAEEPPLPRIEDLTAESDMSAFLRAGVPQALKMAALRRAWSLDPAIRDYVGPAEYAYDFNDPASIPGFGSAAGQNLPSLTQYVAHSNSTQESVMPAGGPGQPDLDPVRRSRTAVAPSPPEPPSPSAEEAQVQNASAEPTAGDPEQADVAEPPSPRHGGAMPR